MFCTKCGKTISDGSTFCPECGATITATQSTSQQYTQGFVQPPPSPPPYGAGYQSAPVYPNVPPQSYGTPYEDTAPLTVGNYLIMFLITIIPLVGLIMQFVWAFGDNVNLNKKNWARAGLIWALIIVVFEVILFIACFGAIGSLIAALSENFSYYGYGYGY